MEETIVLLMCVNRELLSRTHVRQAYLILMEL